MSAGTTAAKSAAKSAASSSTFTSLYTVKWGKKTLKVSTAYLAGVDEMALSREYNTDKKKAGAVELTLPVTLYKEFVRSGNLNISDEIAYFNNRVGKSGAIYVKGVRLANVYQWRLVSVSVTEVHSTVGVIDSARIELTFRSKGWPKGAYAKWRASLKKAATKKTTKKTTKKSKKKTNSQVATEVIAGKWGKTEAVRKKKLTAAGYNYAAVMKIVNARKKK